MTKERIFKTLSLGSLLICVLVWIPNIVFQISNPFWLLTFIIAAIGIVFAVILKNYWLIAANTIMFFSFFIFMFVGYSVIDEMKPKEKEVYNVVILTVDTQPPTQDQAQETMKLVNELNTLSEYEINSFSETVLRDGDIKSEYEEVLKIETYPHIIVLDNEGVVFQTENIDSLKKFFVDN